MNNVSMKFKDNINQARPFYSEAVVTFADGMAPLTLVPNDFVGAQGFKISENTSNVNSFDIGSVAIGQLSMLLNNFDGRFDKYNFDGAVISPTRVFTVLGDQTIEKVNKGKYTVESQSFAGGVVSLVALNDISKFDTPYTGTFSEGTALNIVNSIAAKHNILLSNSTFNNHDFLVTIPNGKNLTDRQVLNYICQITCNYAKLDEDNYLKIQWYDLALLNGLNIISAGTFTEPSTDIISAGTFTDPATNIISGGTFSDLNKIHHITSIYEGYSVDIDDVVITGIKVINESLEEFLSGEEGYILTIQNNPLVTGREQIIADMVASICVGMKFRSLSVPTNCNPIVQAGDIGIVEINGNNYVTIFTNVEFNIGGNCTFSCGAKSPGKNSSNRNTEATVAFLAAKTETEKQLSSYDLQMQALTSLIAQSAGMYKSDVPQEGGGFIYYTHDKATMAGSTTRWSFVGGAFIEETNNNGTWEIVSGTDKQGNALYNVLSARGINAEWIKVLTSFNVNDKFIVDANGKCVADTFESKNAKITGGSISISGSGDSLIMLSLPSMGLAFDLSVLFQKYTNSLNGNYTNSGANGFSFGNASNQLGAMGMDNGVPALDMGTISTVPRITANGYAGASGSLDVITGITYDGTTLSWSIKTLTFKNGLMVTAL